MSLTERTHYRTCHLCEAICGVEIRVRGEEILSIRGDADDPFSRGHICPKAVALKDVHEDPDRLRHPVRRTASGWQVISWDEAFAIMEERLNPENLTILPCPDKVINLTPDKAIKD